MKKCRTTRHICANCLGANPGAQAADISAERHGLTHAPKTMLGANTEDIERRMAGVVAPVGNFIATVRANGPGPLSKAKTCEIAAVPSEIISDAEQSFGVRFVLGQPEACETMGDGRNFYRSL